MKALLTRKKTLMPRRKKTPMPRKKKNQEGNEKGPARQREFGRLIESAKKILEAKKGLSLTYREICDAVGLHPPDLTNWKNGRKPPTLDEKLVRLATYLEIPLVPFLMYAMEQRVALQEAAEGTDPKDCLLPTIEKILADRVAIFVRVADKPGLMARLTTCMFDNELNIERLSTFQSVEVVDGERLYEFRVRARWMKSSIDRLDLQRKITTALGIEGSRHQLVRVWPRPHH